MKMNCQTLYRHFSVCSSQGLTYLAFDDARPGSITAHSEVLRAIQWHIAADGLFIGQPKEFNQLLLHLAEEADEAKREL